MSLTCDTCSSGRVLSSISTSSHKVGMSWMKPQQSCCILKFYGKMSPLKKTCFPIYCLLWNDLKVSMFLCVCVSKSAYVDVFTYCQIKSYVNICINRYLYSHPSILLCTALCDGIHTWNSFLCQTRIFSDHRPESKFSRTRTKFSKEACHVPES